MKSIGVTGRSDGNMALAFCNFVRRMFEALASHSDSIYHDMNTFLYFMLKLATVYYRSAVGFCLVPRCMSYKDNGGQ
jgi:hypothetical protein